MRENRCDESVMALNGEKGRRSQPEAELFHGSCLTNLPQSVSPYFKAYTVAHPFLQRANKEIWDALQEPGGAFDDLHCWANGSGENDPLGIY